MRTDWSELFDPKMPRWWKMALIKEFALNALTAVLRAVGDALLLALRVVLVVGVGAFVVYSLTAHRPYDDTDPPGVRSGMSLYTDAKTGCQYVGAGRFGAITPRLDEHGKQICGVKP